jgi:hypothetical protein
MSPSCRFSVVKAEHRHHLLQVVHTLNFKDCIKAKIREKETTNVSVKELSKSDPTAVDRLQPGNGNVNYVKTALIGLLMGAAEVVPGVSGGTIAFISGHI